MTQSAHAACERLSMLRTLPDIAEGALRAALRDRPSTAEAVLANFDAATRAIPLSTAERVGWRTDVCTMLRSFASSRLAARLAKVPRRLVRGADGRTIDLRVIGRGGRVYGVRFGFLREPLDAARIAKTALQQHRDVDGIVLYDLKRGTTKYIARFRFPDDTRRIGAHAGRSGAAGPGK